MRALTQSVTLSVFYPLAVGEGLCWVCGAFAILRTEVIPRLRLSLILYRCALSRRDAVLRVCVRVWRERCS